MFSVLSIYMWSGNTTSRAGPHLPAAQCQEEVPHGSDARAAEVPSEPHQPQHCVVEGGAPTLDPAKTTHSHASGDSHNQRTKNGTITLLLKDVIEVYPTVAGC